MYFADKPRVIFTSKPLVTQNDKGSIPNFDKAMVVYQLKCYCENSYIGLTSRQVNKRVKEHIPACVAIFFWVHQKKKL